MSFRGAILVALFVAAAVPSASWAQLPLTTSDDAAKGTPAERKACMPDVRKFCASVKADAGSMAFADCLRAHRQELSQKCQAVFVSHGQ